MRLTAPATTTAARTRNTAICGVIIVFLDAFLGGFPDSYYRMRISWLCQHNRQARDHHVQDRKRKQHLPSEIHQLIVAETRKRAAHPNVNEQKNRNLRQEPEGPLYKFDRSGQAE